MTPLTRNASALALLVATFLIRWPFRGVPLIRDEGELAHLAQGLRMSVVPYLEIYNQKPPVAFGLIAALQAVAGESVEVLRLGTSLWFLLAALGVFVIACRWLGDRAALCALAACCLMGVGQAGFFHQASTEVFSLPWLALGIAAWLSARSGDHPRAALVAGIAAALAYQTKQTGIALAAAIALDALLAGTQRATRRAAAWAALGFAALSAALAAVLASGGALGAYLDATWFHNWAYVGSRHAADAIGGGAAGLPVALADLPLWLAGGAGLAVLAAREHAGPLRAVSLLGITTLGTALIAGHTYAHYYVPLIVPLALGCGAFARELEHRTSAWLGALLIATVLAAPLVRALDQLTHVEASVSAVLAQAPTVRMAPDVAQYVAARTRPGEAIAVLGSEPQVYFLARRPAATRMAILYPLSGGYPHSETLLDELIDTLDAAPARYLVVAEDWRSFAETHPNALRLQRRLASLIEADYELEREFPQAFRVLRRRDTPGPHLLLLITADTLRADHLGVYGSTTSLTPSLDALARASLRFTASYATAPYTMPSVASLLTGRYPEELGILANHALFRGTDVMLSELLRREGWRTGAVVSNFVLRRGTGIEKGFELYDDVFTQSETNRDQPERTAENTTDAALAALDALREDQGQRIFLWVHYQDPHGPYLPPGDLRARHLEAAYAAADGRRELEVRGMNPIGALPGYQLVEQRHDVGFYRAGYAGEVDYLDAEIGRLLRGVAERVAATATTVIFTADHGESLGENDYWFAHGAFLSDALIRVPLLIRSPSIEPAVRDDIVSLVDIVPSVLALVGVTPPAALAGRNLLAPRANQAGGRAYLANLMGSADKRWGWVEDGHVLVREHSRIGRERVDLRTLDTATPTDDAARLERMASALAAFRAGLRVQPEVRQHLSPRDLEMLKQLGYAD
jgi:arylsulfatase